MNVAEIKAFVGDLANDTAHERYSEEDILQVLNHTQDEWNLEAAVLKDTVTLTTVDGQREYALSGLTGTPVRFDRVLHNGIALTRRDKSWFDLYSSSDWSDDVGTPKQYYLNVADPDEQDLVLYPTPQAADAGANLIVEYVKRPDTLDDDADIPFNSNTLLYPYHQGLGYRVAAFLLLRDPSQENMIKTSGYLKESNNILTKVIEIFKAQEREEPLRLRGGRYWK